MKVFEIEIKSPKEVGREADAAAKAIKEGKYLEPTSKIVVSSLEILSKILTSERIRMLQVIRANNPSSIYGLAQLMGKDRRNVLRELRYLHGMHLVKVRKEAKSHSPRRNIVPYVDFSKIVVGIPI
ncbi:MAG: ArsR family transcriptional regulator [Candidatus Micrarchaeota archaeon]